MKKKRLGLLIASLILMLSSILTMGIGGTTFADSTCEHSYTEINVPAICTAKGFTTLLCKKCGYQYSDNYVDALGHDYEVEVKEPTCIEGGYTTHTCKTCGYEFKDNIKEANGHTFTEDILEATCTSDGHSTFHCTVCDYEYVGAEIGAKGHHFEPRIVNATCVAYGYTEHICESCKSRYVTDYVKPLGHDFRVEIVPATEDEVGYTKRICKICGYTYLSDFSLSKDSGYIEIPEEPKEPTHQHSYSLDVQVNSDVKTITVNSKCNCGDERNDLVNLIFTDNDGNIQVVNVVDGVANYSELQGEYSVSVVDYNGNVLQEFNISNGQAVVEPKPDTPTVEPTDDEEQGEEKPKTEEHNFEFSYVVDKENKKIKFTYICKDCGENGVQDLAVLFTDKNEVGTVFFPNVKGEIDFTWFDDDYKVSVIIEGVVVENFDLSTKVEEVKEPEKEEPSTEEEQKDTKESEEPQFEGVDGGKEVEQTQEKKQNKGTGTVLIILMGVLATGGVTTIVFIRKKSKKKNK